MSPRRVLRREGLVRCGLLPIFLGLFLLTAFSLLFAERRDVPSAERFKASKPPGNTPASAKAAMINLPLSFEKQDQTQQFHVRGGGYRMLLTSTDATVAVRSPTDERLLRMTLVGANATSEA